MTEEEKAEAEKKRLEEEERIKEGAPKLPLSAEQRTTRLIQICATEVVLLSILAVVVYQTISGHQYFNSRQWFII